MTRAVYRFVNWRIDPHRDLPPMHAFECTTCALNAPDDPGARSPASEDFAKAQDWALRHFGRHPTHNGYRHLTTRYWRTEMTDDQPDGAAQ